MGNLYEYSAVTTKVRGMQAKLITDRSFREMASLGSVTEIAAYLKQYQQYESLFGKTDPEKLHRSDIEKLLIQEQYGDFTKIYRFANMHQRRFMDLYFLHYETELVKRCVRACLSGKKVDLDLSESRNFFKRHGKLDIDRMMNADSIESLLAALQGSIYYSLLEKLSKQENIHLFDYEESLDLFYFKTLWKEKDRVLRKEEVAVATACYGSRLDLLNLQWIRRSRKYYRLESADIYSLLIPEYYKLHVSEIRSLVEAENEETFFSLLDKTYYGKLAKRLIPERDEFGLEKLYATILDRIYSMTAEHDPYSIATVNNYLHRKESEIHKIITVMESVRYSLPPDEIISGILKQKPGRSIA